MAAAMFLIVAGSGLRGRRTLEESGPYVAVRCNNVVLTWVVRDESIDPLYEEKDGGKEEEGGGVVWEMGEEENGEDREESGDELPGTDFGVAGHPGLV
jgi:hypothetical protein